MDRAARCHWPLWTGTALLASTMLVTPRFALAQPVVESTGEAIIVTAQKRTQNLQDVPISIQALGTQQLEERHVVSFSDYTKQLPSVSFGSNQPGVVSVAIRGVSSGGDGNHSGSLPAVGIYLDEQPVTTIGGVLDVHIYDIERIEALSGPQGTLYGASSEAGTIRIITNKPDTSHFYGAVNTQVNSVRHGDFGGKVEGFVNMPLNDSMALRVVGFYEHDAGFIDNIPGTRSFIGGISTTNAQYVKKNFNDADIAGGRAALKVDLDDNWTATASVFGQDQRNHGAFGMDPSLGDLKVQHFAPDFVHDRYLQAALTIEGKIGNWDLTYAGSYLTRKINAESDYIDYAEAYDQIYASYGGVAGYFYFHDNAGNTILSAQRIVGKDNFNKLSQELRIASPADSPLRLVAGLFYQRQYHRIHQDYQVPNLGADVSVNGFPGTLWLTQQDRVDKDYAIFGELSYDILPNLTLTGGLRGFKYDNSLIGFFGFGRNPDGPPYNAAGSSRTGVAGCYNTDGSIVRDNPNGTLVAPAVPGSPCTNLAVMNPDGTVSPKRTKDSGVIHRLNLTWKVTPDHMVYATWSRGFRPGGINRRATIAPYKADFLTNYEVGFKTSWFDRALRWNGAFFWEEWKDFQFSFLGQNSFTEIHNGPNARIKGVETDVTWKATPDLTLSTTAAYIDAKTRKNLCGFDDPTFTCTTPGPDGDTNFISAPAGTRLPITPKFKINASARYEFPMASGTAHVQGVVTHQSSASSDLRTLIYDPLGNPVNPAAGTGRLRAYSVADFTIGIDWDKLSLELFIDNAFDERAQFSRYQECGQCFQRPYIVTNRPRTIGLNAGYKF